MKTEDEKNLDALSARCVEVTGEILDLLEGMKSKKTRSVKEAFISVTKATWKNSRMKELQERLAQVQADVQLQFAVVMRYVSFKSPRSLHSLFFKTSQLPISLETSRNPRAFSLCPYIRTRLFLKSEQNWQGIQMVRIVGLMDSTKTFVTGKIQVTLANVRSLSSQV